MTEGARSIQRTYLLLTLLSTLAASFIWGINTLFLLDAGLTPTSAFAANASFTLGMVLFEIPTGVVADTRGRRSSFLLGTGTLLVSTLLYLLMWSIEAPFWGWAIVSAMIGLGFSFFSGAVEAWLVDALTATGFTGSLETVFGKAQSVAGVAMLTGTVAGGLIAQATTLAMPYIVRAVVLGITLAVAFRAMKDLGFRPNRETGPIAEVRRILRSSVDGGLRRPQIRWMMLTSPFLMGAAIYSFYALQPHLLDLHGDDTAYWVAGLAAALLAAAQIAGGLFVPAVRRLFARRSTAIASAVALGSIALAGIGVTEHLGVALVLVAMLGVALAAATPLRQAYLNGLIGSDARATVLSFDALLGSAGGVVTQPALGRSADAFGYGTSYLISAGVLLASMPFLVLARRSGSPSDVATSARRPA